MGVKHFWIYLQGQFSHCITTYNKKHNIIPLDIKPHNLLLDLNGIFHEAAREVYTLNNSLTRRENDLTVFKKIVIKIQEVIDIVNPQKRIVFCVDGPAPLSKQNQQRQRRYRSVNGTDVTSDYSSTEITPGTKFLESLTNYLRWYVLKGLQQNKKWSNLEIIFSDEKVPGEGEAKCFNYTRYYGNKNESYCMFGNDADLIMLSLCCGIKQFYILRENFYTPNQFFLVNISDLSDSLGEKLHWNNSLFEVNNGVLDFVCLCFLVGNDFLPNIPSLEILQRGLDLIIDIYKVSCKDSGHIIQDVNNQLRFNNASLKAFFNNIARYEKELLEEKYQKSGLFISNDLIEKHIQIKEGEPCIDLESYKKEYYDKKMHLSQDKIESVCKEYINGMNWVINYYVKGVPDWNWLFPHNYAPFASDIEQCIESHTHPIYLKHQPLHPFQQLLCVLPPFCSHLLPKPLDSIFQDEESYPKEFVLDTDGKRKEWEGIVILPIINYTKIMTRYNELIQRVSQTDLQRNKFHRSVILRKNFNVINAYYTYYGLKSFNVQYKFIDL